MTGVMPVKSRLKSKPKLAWWLWSRVIPADTPPEGRRRITRDPRLHIAKTRPRPNTDGLRPAPRRLTQRVSPSHYCHLRRRVAAGPRCQQSPDTAPACVSRCHCLAFGVVLPPTVGANSLRRGLPLACRVAITVAFGVVLPRPWGASGLSTGPQRCVAQPLPLPPAWG